jgi:hypothetical protein
MAGGAVLRWIFAVIAILVLANVTFAGTTVIPTTTLNAELGNNTSASAYFTAKSNGNLGAGNVSDVSVKSLLYSGATTKVYAHVMPWFGGSNHMDVGYASNDPAQVREQVAAMRDRGIDGVIIDWYGRNFSREDQATYYFKQEGERLGGSFKFAVMEDAGALRKCAATRGCSVTTEMISDLNYAYNNYMKSSAYMRIDGRPVVFFFGVEAFYIDWNSVRSSVLGNPLFIRQNAGGFTNVQSNGSFGWVAIDRDDPYDIGLTYLDGFYSTGIKYSTKKPYGAVYKGFNDSLAAWHPTPYRLMKQNCGQTWLATWERVKKYYSSSRQLQNMQLVTWNDYEEGTALETGIDNCVGVTASTEGTAVKWSITGQQNTLDHFKVFISTDGTNLMRVADVPASSRSLDLKSWGFAAGTYTVYVKSVGKPFLRNKMSEGASLKIASTSSSTGSTTTSTYGVRISSPVNNGTSGSTVHVAATAISSSPITAMHVYVDHVKRAATSSAKVDAWLTMTPGSRYVVVQAWDSSGKVYKSSVTVKVQ